ncbi:MAG: ribonuclease H family protein [Bacteroides sp.]|nr:ribonuclease H family protein [Lachnospiraceae bacterium]MCM1333305.1 ribonuclease H family protein [Bacteroides sp.]MCM1389981.1 ribonuclease H family protein [Bacteroides sp.]
MAHRKFYVVWAGHSPGIYDSWEECKAQVANFPGARYKAFSSQDEATAAYRGDPSAEMYALRAIASRNQQVVNYSAFPEIRTDAIAVDAACAGNPGKMEYRGVEVGTGKEIFHVGPLDDGTNNIGEFLALVHGLALCKKNGDTSTPIYSDSVTAQSWVRRKKAKTTLAPTPRNAKIFELVQRAEYWLAHNTWTNPIVKWDTESWGEIPADFGRK